MRLGERSTRIGSGNGGQLIRLALGLLIAGCGLTATAGAQTTSVGPGRIFCNAAFCELGSGSRPKERYRVIVSDLTRDEVRRLRKCTGVGKPCIVTIEGVEQGGPMRIMATAIHWFASPGELDSR
jgi:hypothetical protein